LRALGRGLVQSAALHGRGRLPGRLASPDTQHHAELGVRLARLCGQKAGLGGCPGRGSRRAGHRSMCRNQMQA